MNMLTTGQHTQRMMILILGIALFFLAACTATPISPDGAAEARSKLTALQNDANLADRARVEVREAETAVSVAEKPLSKSPEDAALGKHRVYMADSKVEIAKAKASARYAESQRARLGEERDEARLKARTREADNARRDANSARDAADAAKNSEKESAAAAARKEAELRKQIDELEAKATERGLVLTLGDVLFSTGSAELRGGANSNLDKLVNFLNKYPERNVQIEGHTDNVGSADYNQGLSQRRAESVRSYLQQQGIAPQRLSASGIGMGQPIADNASAAGRQQNRRVEIIIDHQA